MTLPASAAIIQSRFQSEYDALWAVAFKDMKVPQAALKAMCSDDCSKYWHKEDRIEIHIPDLDYRDLQSFLENPQWADFRADPMDRWKGTLIHEMIHEYQHKVSPAVSDAAVSLAKAYNHRHEYDPNSGHGDDFFEALILVASKLNFTPAHLANNP